MVLASRTPAMPRIDPHQLLSCLGVLLTPSGGILSKNEVQRLANLMTKFSKKLVSKCVYVLILKNTENPLLGAFMAEGGWNLVQVWLQDGYNNRNWALVMELLDLLIMSPTDVEQLKMNNLPKLVKSLSKRDDLEKVKKLANNLVSKWLKIVKDDQMEKIGQAINADQQQNQKLLVNNSVSEPVQVVEVPVVQVEQEGEDKSKSDPQIINKKSDSSVSVNAQPCYKLAVRDGKHVLCKVPPSEANVTVVENAIIEDITPVEAGQDGVTKVGEDARDPEQVPEDSREKKEADKRKEKSNHDRHKHRSNSSSSKSSSSSSRSGKDKDRRSRDKSKEKSRSSSSHERNKDKSKHDRHKNNGDLKSSSKSSSSSSKEKDRDRKETKEKQAEKDKDTLAKLQTPSLSKIGRIPKKSSEEKKDDKKEDAKKPTFSIEVRKNSEEKPKTVKVFNAKMRSTGLLEEAKPPPPRSAKKQPPANLPPVLPQKRPSPVRDLIPPPEKKPKTDTAERPGAIKLIPPKPKRFAPSWGFTEITRTKTEPSSSFNRPPRTVAKDFVPQIDMPCFRVSRKAAVLQESDIFMDALTAASAKKEPKKRKRRASVSKDSQGSPPASPSVTTTPTVPQASPMALKSITPPKFYQDTLETDTVDKEKTEQEQPQQDEDEVNENPRTPTDSEGKMEVDENKSEPTALKSVLVHVKRKGPKKSIRWKADEDLVEVQYFELDETERVNVTKTFMDMAKMEMSSEREALMSRKLQNEDLMSAQTSWKFLIEIDMKVPLVEAGSKSLEKDIQFAREKTTVSLPPLIHGRYIDYPAEPEPEVHQMTDPISIPLDDPENAEQEMPVQAWPEPKGSPPQVAVPNIPPIFSNIQPPFQNFNVNGPPPPFQNLPFGAPGFMPPTMMGGPNNGGNEWNNMNNVNNINNMNNMNNMNNAPIIPPNMPPDMMAQGPPPNMFGPNHDNFNPNMNDNFTPFNQPNMGMYPPNNFNNMRGGRGGFRRGGGNGPWVRMNGPGPGPGGWNRGGGMNRGGRFCKNVKNHGYCRNRDNCPFIHPN